MLAFLALLVCAQLPLDIPVDIQQGAFLYPSPVMGAINRVALQAQEELDAHGSQMNVASQLEIAVRQEIFEQTALQTQTDLFCQIEAAADQYAVYRIRPRPPNMYDYSAHVHGVMGGEFALLSRRTFASNRLILDLDEMKGIFAESQEQVTMGYAATHGRRAELTIPAAWFDATQVNFPVGPFTIANLPSEMFDADGSYPALSTGADVRFSLDEDGDTPCNVQIVTFSTNNNPALGTCEIWVRVPSCSSTVDTPLWVWWSAPGATLPAANSATEGSEGVWDANFKAVYHLQETNSDTAGNYKDSTANDNHMTGVSMGLSPAAATWGSGGLAAEFDGGADYLTSNTVPLTADNYSMSCWMYPDIETAAMVMSSVSYKNAGNVHTYLGAIGNATNDPIRAASRNTTLVGALKTDFAASVWSHVHGRWPASNSRFAGLNGVEGTEEATDVTFMSNLNQFTIGVLSIDPVPVAYFDGKLDEIRVSSISRSAAWFAAEHSAGNAPGDITVGTPESPGGSATGNPWYAYAQQ